MPASQTADVSAGTVPPAGFRTICRLILCSALLLGSAAVASMAGAVSVASAHGSHGSTPPDFGPNVYVFSPSMPQSEIQSQVDAIANQQLSNQFGDQRYALLFEPGTYGSKADPLTFQVGYYTEVAGLGSSPSDVVINGTIDVYNQCFGPNNCTALENFWRSLSNLTINVTGQTGCHSGGDFWAVSQAAPMRRVDLTGGNLSLMDYCSNPAYASGGFIADSAFSGGTVINGSQQQFLVRNSNLDGWTNGVWDQVFSGDVGAPAQSFPNPPYTTLPTSPVTREEPFLFTDSSGKFEVMVPAVQHNSVGTSWSNGATPGRVISIKHFFIAQPGESVKSINKALAHGMDLILTPGVYSLDRTIRVTHPDTVVLGLGFPTLVAENGIVSMKVNADRGVELSGMIFDAGAKNSSALLEVAAGHGRGHGHGHHDRTTRSHHGGGGGSAANDPSTLQDVFFRIGGAEPGRATTSLVVNADHVILDDVWAWRADHGAGVGWNSNTADTGLVVNGADVTAYGLFVEHYQKYQVIWNGQGGTDIFFQNEMPYDPPDQASWMASSQTDGYPAFLVTSRVASFQGYGMASYCYFNQGVPIFASRAFQIPVNPGVQLHDVLTRFLNGSGGIYHVVNDTGAEVSQANPGPSNVVSYP